MTRIDPELTPQACFPQPEDFSSPIWRYLSLPKFISLLQTSALHLSRLDLLKDQHEGSLPAKWAAARDSVLSPAVGDIPARMTQQVRKASYVNCWTLSPSESEGLWRLYTAGGDGIALQSRYEELCNVVKSGTDLICCKVTYLDYEESDCDESTYDTQHRYWTNFFPALTHKRREFAHENEVRLIKVLREHLIPIDGSSVGPSGIAVPIDLTTLIQGIYISPYAESWYGDIVKEVVEKFAPFLAHRVSHSRMTCKPRW